MNYRLTENKKVFNGETLFQIECIEDCKYAKVGELGGYIASYDNLADGAWVNKDVCVCDTSVVRGYVKGGFVAGNSIVEGKVTGAVVGSYVDESSELDHAFLLNSKIINTRHKTFSIGLKQAVALIILSKIVDSELKGNIVITNSYIEESIINWNNVEDMQVINDTVFEEDVNEETGEVEFFEREKGRFLEINEKLKDEWEMGIVAFEKNEDVHTEDEEADMLFNENKINMFKTEKEAEALLKEVVDMGDYYKGLMGEVFYSIFTIFLNAGKE